MLDHTPESSDLLSSDLRKKPEAAFGTSSHTPHVSECLRNSVLRGTSISPASPLPSAVFFLHKLLEQASQKNKLILKYLLFYDI